MNYRFLLTLILAFLFTSCKKDEIINNEITQQSCCSFTDFKYYNGQKDNLGELQNKRWQVLQSVQIRKLWL